MSGAQTQWDSPEWREFSRRSLEEFRAREAGNIEQRPDPPTSEDEHEAWRQINLGISR